MNTLVKILKILNDYLLGLRKFFDNSEKKIGGFYFSSLEPTGRAMADFYPY